MIDTELHAALPAYQSHSVVRAAPIVDINAGASAITIEVDDSLHVVEVGADWIARPEAVRGGYLVVHSDGYSSYMSAVSFEAMHRRVPVEGGEPLVLMSGRVDVALDEEEAG